MIKLMVIGDGLTIQTQGLQEYAGYELQASVHEVELVEACKEFVACMADYMANGNPVRSGETLAYGYWLTKVNWAAPQLMTFSEYEPEATHFIEGVSLTLSYAYAQKRVCARVGLPCVPLRPDQKIAISEGVYEGDPVAGVRYEQPAPMSGWFLTTDRYDGNVASLKVVHAFHVSAKRPDLAQYFALPSGYRFWSDTEDVWFDPNVASQ